ncbi:Protein SET DOMAIN GROUP 41 [Camellia lanceoleosa]|uniref:Protein SET DOMAIN GROUP 41 n=1 Tax=Camellia lanceoleosa TaxID=1840588 RepID=A0ACC0HRM8_9ERIC|nr:Protein SET DOMAIN GROUP 41 [Camellia lanceoleosa]
MEMRRSQDISIGQDLARSLRFLSPLRAPQPHFRQSNKLMSSRTKKMTASFWRGLGWREGCETAWLWNAQSGSNGIEMMENGDCQNVIQQMWVLRNIISYGPRIIVASIKPINMGEEVSAVAYTDLLQPKEISAVNCGCANLSSETDYVDDAITEYLTVVNPNSYCEKLENLLIHGLLDGQFEPKEEKSKQQFWLHPLHHLSSSAYTTLASAYKTRASYLLALNPEMYELQLEAFDMSRTSAACSLLLAGATNHLFLSGSSLIASVANFCTSTGETLLNVARSCVWKLLAKRGLTIAELSHFPGYKCCNYALSSRFSERGTTGCEPGTAIASGFGFAFQVSEVIEVTSHQPRLVHIGSCPLQILLKIISDCWVGTGIDYRKDPFFIVFSMDGGLNILVRNRRCSNINTGRVPEHPYSTHSTYRINHCGGLESKIIEEVPKGTKWNFSFHKDQNFKFMGVEEFS